MVLYIPLRSLSIQQPRFSFSPSFPLHFGGEAFLPLARITELLSTATPFSPYDSSALLRPRDCNLSYPPSSGPRQMSIGRPIFDLCACRRIRPSLFHVQRGCKSALRPTHRARTLSTLADSARLNLEQKMTG